MQEVWALKDINFEIKRGEAVAIIGRNGGGKSTLLEILTGTLTPTTGEVKVNGRVSALLELGSGFNPEYSGRDNVILNGLLLGLSKEDILSRFGEIEAFAEIGAAIDRPVKTYSTGMMMRLAFAVQVLCDPDILIIDEALSVGDFFFQQKCFSYIRDLCAKGVTLIFVSHDMGTVRDLCPNSIYLRQGDVAFLGDSQEAIRKYLSEGTAQGLTDTTSSSTHEEIEEAIEQKISLENATQVALWRRNQDSLSSDNRLLAVVIRDENGLPVTSTRMGSKLIFQVFFRTLQEESGHIGLIVKNKYDQIINSSGSYLMGMDAMSTKGSYYEVFEFEIDSMIEAGLYSIMIVFSRPNAQNQGEILDSTGWIGPLEVYWKYDLERAPFLGMFGIPCRARKQAASKHNRLLTSEEIVTRSILTGKDRSGEGGMEIIAACVTDKNGNHTLSVNMTEELRFYIYARAHRVVKKPYFGIVIYDKAENLIFTGTTLQIMDYSPELTNEQEIVVGFKVKMTIQAGQYTFRLSCAEPLVPYHPNKGVSLDAHGALGPITVLFDYEKNRAPFYGIAQLPMEII